MKSIKVTDCIFLLCFFLALGEAINFYTQIVAGFLPEDFAVGHVKQILIPYFIATKNIKLFNKESSSFMSSI